MADPVARFATRFAYGATQLPRVAWYVGHDLLMRRLSRAQNAQKAPARARRPQAQTHRLVPDRRELYADMARLFWQDLANVEAGIYPLPADHDGSLPILIDRSRLFFSDLPRVHRRRERGDYREVVGEAPERKRPEYYLQNFHFQSGGWMTEDSARRYDTQVEVLFKGSANAIRRQALPPLHEVFAGHDQRRLRLLDIGCGTGRFLDFVKQTWPRLPALGLDMSEAYVLEAKAHLRRWCWTNLVVGNGEGIPLPDASTDAVTSIFVFHELPPEVRRAVMREGARVLKRGGRMVIVDSLQLGDEPRYDGMLDLFPQNFHEPYYRSYVRENFSELACTCGLHAVRAVTAFISKVMVFDKQ
jgi:ubiquinone/menaquinone biosynthesis C-methylase UbiE